MSIKLSTPLTVNEIEFRVQSINRAGSALIIPYKDARCDMTRLDAVYPGLWQRKHEVINTNLFCSVGVYNDDIKEWVWVQDVGTKSNTEAEKGEASDSFKRACFNLGIGRELYDYPVIKIALNGGGDKNSGDTEWFLDEKDKDRYGKARVKQGWGLKIKEWSWYSEFKDGHISFLAAKDQNKKMRFVWGKMAKKEAQAQGSKTA